MCTTVRSNFQDAPRSALAEAAPGKPSVPRQRLLVDSTEMGVSIIAHVVLLEDHKRVMWNSRAAEWGGLLYRMEGEEVI